MSKPHSILFTALSVLVVAFTPSASVAADPADPTATWFRLGDVNDDGHVQVADAIFLLRFLFLGGDPPGCEAAADVNEDGDIGLADATTLLHAITVGVGGFTTTCVCHDPGVQPLSCDSVDPMLCPDTPPPCCDEDARYRLAFDGVDRFSGTPGGTARFLQTVTLEVPDPSEVQGFSLSVLPTPQSACSITGSDFTGTVSETAAFKFADVGTDESGVAAGHVAAVVFDFTLLTGLGSGLPDPHELIVLELESPVPSEGEPCVICELEFVDGLLGPGGVVPVDNLVTDDSTPAKPSVSATSIDVCPIVIQSLHPDDPRSVRICPGPPDRQTKDLLGFTATTGQVAVLDIQGTLPDDENAVYVRFGAYPEPGIYDYAADLRGTSAQRLVIPFTRAGTYYVRPVTNFIKAAKSEILVELTFPSITLSGMSVDSVGQSETGCIHTRVFGGGFSDDTIFALQEEGGPARFVADAVESRVISSGEALLEFHMAGAGKALYSLTAKKPGAAGVFIKNAFQVFADTDSERARLDVRLDVNDRVRMNRVRSLVVRWENPGDQEIRSSLLRLRTDPGVKLRLESQAEFGDNVLEFLAADPHGVPGFVGPHESGEVRVYFEVQTDHEENSTVDFHVDVLSPNRRDEICWDNVDDDCDGALAPPSGLANFDWERVRQVLRAERDEETPLSSFFFGSLWRNYPSKLAEFADSVALRGGDPASVVDALELLLLLADGQSTAGVFGTLRQEDGSPIVGETVFAIDSDGVAGCATTNERGFFFVDGLAGEAEYTIDLEHFSVEVDPLFVEAGDARSFLDVLAAPRNEPQSLDCTPNPRPIDLDGTIAAPDELYSIAAGRQVTLIRPIDPNEKNGPKGQGEGDLGFWVPPVEPIAYEIQFENCDPDKPNCPPAGQVIGNPGDQDIGTAVQVATITDVLPPQLDPTTVKFGAVGVGNHIQMNLTPKSEIPFSGSGPAPLCPDGYGGFATYPLDEDLGLTLAVESTVDFSTRTIEWVFSTLDATGKVVDAAQFDDAGFLPPNALPPEGEAWVKFSVQPFAGLAEGTGIVNRATIQFDDEQSLQTSPANNQIIRSGFELPKPIPRRPEPRLDRVVDLDVSLHWEYEFGDAVFDVFLFKDGEEMPENPTAKNITGRSFTPPLGLEPATVFRWRVVARLGPLSVISDEGFFLTDGGSGLFVRGDSNGDGGVDISDPISLLNYQFLGGPAPLCRDSADANDDEKLDIADGVSLLVYLFQQGAPPPDPSPSATNWSARLGLADCGVDPTTLDNGLECGFFRPCHGAAPQ